MKQVKGRIRFAGLAVVLLILAGCSVIVRNHGYVPRDDELEQIVVGVDTKVTVADVVGRPSAAGVLSSGGWYYVQSRFESFAFRAPREVNRQVVAISFDGDDVVSNIERFGLQDGRVIALSRRVTDSNVQGIGFLRQLFGNLGNFTADQLLN